MCEQTLSKELRFFLIVSDSYEKPSVVGILVIFVLENCLFFPHENAYKAKRRVVGISGFKLNRPFSMTYSIFSILEQYFWFMEYFLWSVQSHVVCTVPGGKYRIRIWQENWFIV